MQPKGLKTVFFILAFGLMTLSVDNLQAGPFDFFFKDNELAKAIADSMWASHRDSFRDSLVTVEKKELLPF